LYDAVVGHVALNWLGAATNNLGTDCVYVECAATGCKTELPIAEIGKHRWEDLEAVFLGKREANIMRHVTRIVGYYSELRNWNASKLAELDDRHAGQYGVPEPAPVAKEPEMELAIA